MVSPMSRSVLDTEYSVDAYGIALKGEGGNLVSNLSCLLPTPAERAFEVESFESSNEA